MPKQFIADLKDRDSVDSVFMVKEKTMAMAKNGKPYMNLKFMDKSGEIDGKLWDNVDELDKSFQKGDFVQIRGTGSLYMGKMQLVAKEIKRLEDALVEERAWTTYNEETQDARQEPPYQDVVSKYNHAAREQLRAEGVIR